MDHLTHWHILIIQDNPADRAVFKQMLMACSSHTCHFTDAELGSEGLQLILNNQAQSVAGAVAPFDCVLLDLLLPDLSALQLLNTLCGTADMPPCPVVVMTNWDGVDAHEGPKLLQAGAQDYIGKSWTTPPSLCRAIENSIDRFKLQQSHAQAWQALTHSEQRYRTLFNAIVEGFCIIEMMFDAKHQPINYRYVEVNQSFQTQTGFLDAIGRTVLELIPEIESTWLQAYGKVAQTGEPIRLNGYVQHLNKWFDVYAFQLGDPIKRQVGVLFNDITERKFLENRLHDAVAASEIANRAKSDFLSSMSHELHTPLNAILGFAQLVENSVPPLTLNQQNNLKHILDGGWYLLELVNEVLDLAQIESGRLSLTLESISLVNVLLECQDLVEPLAQQRAISMTFPQTELSPLALADRTRLKQALLNLLSNAIKYNTHGGSIVVECALNTPDYARISIRDTGTGLTSNQLEKLFQPFNRLGREVGAQTGTGIGLAVTKNLIELMEGSVGAESIPGAGSTFWVDLPLASPPLQETVAPRG
jgi:signal transduction histidine kinase